jgi:REP element-mobilizing transposase RayT
MPRAARLDAPGVLHHIIIRGIERRKIFRDAKDRENLLERLGSLLSETKTTCYAWALLPNHAHFLLRIGEVALATVMRRLLTGYAVSFNRRHRRHGHLLQNRYKSIICQEETYFKELVRYLHLNPLRAGIVPSLARLESYPYCGHSAVLGAWRGRVGIYRMRKHTGMTNGQIGEIFGGLTYSAVAKARERFARQLCTDRTLRRTIQEITTRMSYAKP